MQAAHSGNISASVCVAQIMDGRGDTAAALKFWSKAAKLSHPEAQFRLGRVIMRLSHPFVWALCEAPGMSQHAYVEVLKALAGSASCGQVMLADHAVKGSFA